MTSISFNVEAIDSGLSDGLPVVLSLRLVVVLLLGGVLEGGLLLQLLLRPLTEGGDDSLPGLAPRSLGLSHHRLLLHRILLPAQVSLHGALPPAEVRLHLWLRSHWVWILHVVSLGFHLRSSIIFG